MPEGIPPLIILFLSVSDYVCVLDIDLLELAITTWKGTDSSKLVSFMLTFNGLKIFSHFTFY